MFRKNRGAAEVYLKDLPFLPFTPGSTRLFFRKNAKEPQAFNALPNAGSPVYKSEEMRRDRMSGFLTTHVLDTARGCPAEGLKIELFRIEGDRRQLLKTLSTNDDGRTDEQILPAEAFEKGVYELVFHAGAYLDAIGTPPRKPAFSGCYPAALRHVGGEPLSRASAALSLRLFHLSRQLKPVDPPEGRGVGLSAGHRSSLAPDDIGNPVRNELHEEARFRVLVAAMGEETGHLDGFGRGIFPDHDQRAGGQILRDLENRFQGNAMPGKCPVRQHIAIIAFIAPRRPEPFRA